MKNNDIQVLELLISENQASRIKAIQKAEQLYSLKKHLCVNELPAFAYQLNSMQNVPNTVKNQINSMNTQVCSQLDESTVNFSLPASLPKDEQQIIANTFSPAMLENIKFSTTLDDGINLSLGLSVLIPYVGPLIAGYKIIKQIKQIKEQEEKTQNSTTIFHDAIEKMDHLIKSAERGSSEISKGVNDLSEGSKNYDHISDKQQQELLDLIERMTALTDELNLKIDVVA